MQRHLRSIRQNHALDVKGMTSIASPGSSIAAATGAGLLSGALARPLLLLVTVAGSVAGLLATGTEASASAVALAGADLTHLLRAMALLKGAMAAAMAAAVLWRLGSPVTPARWAAYALACAGMAGGQA